MSHQKSEAECDKFCDKFNDKFCDKFNDMFNNKFENKFDSIFNQKFNEKFNSAFGNLFEDKINELFNDLFFEMFNDIFDEMFTNKFNSMFYALFNKLFNDKFNELFTLKFNAVFGNDYVNGTVTETLTNTITDKLSDKFVKFDEKLLEKMSDRMENLDLIGKLNQTIDKKLNEKLNEKINKCVDDRFNDDFEEELENRFEERINERLNTRLNTNMGAPSAEIFETGLEKHQKYKSFYGTGEIFHGIGIENELYLEFESGINVTKTNFINNRKRERYSVDYNTGYKTELLNKLINTYANNIYSDNIVKLPLLINSHSFTHTDSQNNSRTMYTKLCEPNPKYSGKTLIETLSETNEYIKTQNDVSYTFDGDTIEFMTLNFYNANIDDVFTELRTHKTKFIQNINQAFEQGKIFSQYGKVQIMSDNYPFATSMTNLRNVNMFNNGTIHINITLPTLLNKRGKVANKNKFIERHRNYIKYVQYMEPLMISVYGAPDILSTLDTDSLYSKSSQRCAVSRYIGVGTYDCDKMISGKILSTDISDLECAKNDFYWYNKFHANSGYVKLDKVGLDINFNKHFNHGVEIRFFDHMSDAKLQSALEFLIYLGDFVLDNSKNDMVLSATNPIYDVVWNDTTEKCLRHGPQHTLDQKSLDMYSNLFGFEIKSKIVSEVYNEINMYLQKMYKLGGKFSKRCM